MCGSLPKPGGLAAPLHLAGGTCVRSYVRLPPLRATAGYAKNATEQLLLVKSPAVMQIGSREAARGMPPTERRRQIGSRASRSRRRSLFDEIEYVGVDAI